MNRTIVITGSASGIGRATADRLRATGDTVIGIDLRDAEIEADLATATGRARMIRDVTLLAPSGIDAVLAGAGISQSAPSPQILAVNYFGAIATLDGLRGLLSRSSRPRAVAICSAAALLPGADNVVRACLELDEPAALAEAERSSTTGYLDSKRALSLWVRRAAIQPQWAGAGILLNGIAPGLIKTPMSLPLLQQPETAAFIRQSTPIAVDDYAEPEVVAELLAFFLGFENNYLLGQIVFIDGGTDAIMRPDHF